MRTEYFKHEGVGIDGCLKGGGAVETGGIVRTSMPNGGCDLQACSCSDGHWLCYTRPRTADGVVEGGVTIYFENKKEMAAFEKEFVQNHLLTAAMTLDGLLDSAAGRAN